MNQNDPSGLIRMLDDFRSGTNLQYRRQSSTYFTNPLPVPVPLSLNDGERSKRPFDETVLNENDMLIKKSRKNDSLQDDSLNDSTGSPWETTHAKSQLAMARAEIRSLENRLSQLHGLRKESEHIFEQEKNALRTNIEQDRNTIRQLEKRVSALKRREGKSRDDISTLMSYLNSQKGDLELKNTALSDEIIETKNDLTQLKGKLIAKEQEFKTLNVEKQRLENEIKLCNDKCSALSAELTKLRQSVSDFETTKASLANAQLTIKELENAKKSYEEMDLMVKSQQNKLMRYSELERNLKHFMYENSKMKEACSNTVHLEALVEEMRQRLKTLEEREKELVKIRIDVGVAEVKLSEYRTLAAEALGENAGATQLGAYVRQLQTNSLLSACQQSQLTSKVKCLEDSEKVNLAEIAKLKQEMEKLKDELNSTNLTLRRLKKQNTLITWERNDLRSLVDSCQKEVTISGGLLPTGEEGRVELLEKMVEGYRERIKQMESDPSLVISGVNCSTSPVSEKSEKDIAELEKLRNENETLKDTVKKLKYEMEHRSLKGDFNTLNTRILHVKNNPTSEAMNTREDELTRLRQELFDKTERLKMYSEGNFNDITQEIALKQDVAKEVIELREKVKSQETVNQRLKEAFKTKGHEFREAIFALLGYKVDGLPNSLYRLSSLYAEAHEQYLMFKMTGNGMELLETDYSKLLSELVEEVLLQDHSIPVFLSTLTIDLFKKQSHTISMSTTSVS